MTYGDAPGPRGEDEGQTANRVRYPVRTPRGAREATKKNEHCRSLRSDQPTVYENHFFFYSYVYNESVPAEGILHPFSTAVPIEGQTTLVPSGLPPKRDGGITGGTSIVVGGARRQNGYHTVLILHACLACSIILYVHTYPITRGDRITHHLGRISNFKAVFLDNGQQGESKRRATRPYMGISRSEISKTAILVVCTSMFREKVGSGIRPRGLSYHPCDTVFSYHTGDKGWCILSPV